MVYIVQDTLSTATQCLTLVLLLALWLSNYNKRIFSRAVSSDACSRKVAIERGENII